MLPQATLSPTTWDSTDPPTQDFLPGTGSSEATGPRETTAAVANEGLLRVKFRRISSARLDGRWKREQWTSSSREDTRMITGERNSFSEAAASVTTPVITVATTAAEGAAKNTEEASQASSSPDRNLIGESTRMSSAIRVSSFSFGSRILEGAQRLSHSVETTWRQSREGGVDPPRLREDGGVIGNQGADIGEGGNGDSVSKRSGQRRSKSEPGRSSESSMSVLSKSIESKGEQSLRNRGSAGVDATGDRIAQISHEAD